MGADTDLTMQALAQLAKEFGDVVLEVSSAISDGKVSENELSNAEKQWGELMSVGRHLMAGLRAKHEASKPANLRAVG
jgi:hypothetical protein